ncbi:MAG: hypothetical protein P1U41_10745, partial [Vicingaceae bacterium]|nr:hypothetical protein [Vicingaceae bacterium]
MRKLLSILLLFLVNFTISYSQPFSATQQVISPTINGSVTNYGRGFDFTPSVNITIVSLGKRVPIMNTQPITWKIWQVNNQALIHSQTSVATTPTVYTYEPISAPVTLLAGVRYSLTLYGNYQYYYGPSNQIHPLLTYHTMRYCNGCYAAQPFPTSLLNNYHYGNPDFMFTTCPPPPALPSISGPLTVCQGASVTYTTPAQVGATNYNWTVPAGATITAGQGTNTLNVTWNATPGGQICADWTDSCATSPPLCINVTVSPPPTMTTPANITVCNGDNVPASAFVSNPVGATFAW